MFSRREVGIGFAALGLTGVSCTVAAATMNKTVFRMANPNGVTDATQCWSTCGDDPRLGYYEMEGVRSEKFAVANLLQSMMAAVQGQVEVGTAVPAIYLPALVKEPNLGIIGIYNPFPRNSAKVIVKPDSGIRTAADLVGKKIGCRSLGDGADATIKILFADLGLPRDNFQMIAVGDVGLAGNALEKMSVDAFSTYDTIAGRIETLGFPIRYLPLTNFFESGSASWFAVKNDLLKSNRKGLVGVFRATAKSTLFAYHNLPAAITLHWAVFPESKPKTKSEAEALQDMLLILKDRREAWMPVANDPDQRIGATTAIDWESAKRTASTATNNTALAQQVGSTEKVFTNELIDEINDFDHDAIVKQAREFIV